MKIKVTNKKINTCLILGEYKVSTNNSKILTIEEAEAYVKQSMIDNGDVTIEKVYSTFEINDVDQGTDISTLQTDYTALEGRVTTLETP